MTNEEIITKSLDDAAEAYGKRQGLEDKPYAIKYFKAGAEWRDAQILKLPNNLDNAAKEYANIQDEGDKEKYVNGYLYNGFYAGAEWMAAQGDIFETEPYFCTAEGDAEVSVPTTFKPNEKVIVQIRKKEE